MSAGGTGVDLYPRVKAGTAPPTVPGGVGSARGAGGSRRVEDPSFLTGEGMPSEPHPPQHQQYLGQQDGP